MVLYFGTVTMLPQGCSKLFCKIPSRKDVLAFDMLNPDFLSDDEIRQIQIAYGTPVFVYDRAVLEDRARRILEFPNAFGLTARFAMKALPTAAIIRLMSDWGLHIDASSGYEAERAMRAGVPAARIQITAQELPVNMQALIEAGCRFNSCSLHQLNSYGLMYPGSQVAVRINPGLGSGHSNRTNVGGVSSSFGIWHEHLPELFAIAEQHKLRVTMMHTHIGSGSDPETWVHCAELSLRIAAELPDVTTLSLGGGYKVGRVPGEVNADVQQIGNKIVPMFEAFARQHQRQLHLEVEPGTWLVAHAGILVCSVMDVVDTGADGNKFIKIDSGMTEILRPSLYGSQHPIQLTPKELNERPLENYLVVGHCCESGDILTPEPGNPEGLLPRSLQSARIGDIVTIGAAGAYCSAMASKNYNSFPECAEVLRLSPNTFRLIRRRQTLEQMLANEILEYES